MKRETETAKKENMVGPAGSNATPQAPDKPNEAPAPKEGSIRKVTGKKDKGEQVEETKQNPGA